MGEEKRRGARREEEEGEGAHDGGARNY